MTTHGALNRDQLAERRRKGGRLLLAGRLSQAEIARRLGVSRPTVSDWAKQLAAGGLRGLRRRKAPGRPSRLTGAQRQRLVQLLQQPVQAAGFSAGRWTGLRIQRLIQREFGLWFHVSYVTRLLTQLGWSWREQRMTRRPNPLR